MRKTKNFFKTEAETVLLLIFLVAKPLHSRVKGLLADSGRFSGGFLGGSSRGEVAFGEIDL